MLAENLVDPYKPVQLHPAQNEINSPGKADMNEIDEPLDLNAGNQNLMVLPLLAIALSMPYQSK